MLTYYAYFSKFKSSYGNPLIPEPVVKARNALKLELDRSKSTPRPAPAPAAAAPMPAPAPAAVAPVPGAPRPVPGAPKDRPENDSPGRPLIIGGSVALVLGAAAIIPLAWGGVRGARAQRARDESTDLEEIEEIDRDGKRANTVLIAGAVVMPVMIVTGAVLVGVGLKRNRDASNRVAFAPTFDRSSAGVSFSGRF
jgi:hypothetical protein